MSPLWKEKEQGHLVKLRPSLLLPVVEVEKTLGRVNTQKGSHILIVGEGGAKPDEPDILLGHLNVSDGPGHQRL